MAHLDWISLRGNDEDEASGQEKDFQLYVADLSYFSGKLEMYFRYKELNFTRIEPTLRGWRELWKVTGSEQFPQVYDGRPGTEDSRRWLRDTTPIIEHLEMDPAIQSRPNNKQVIPECPVHAFCQRLLEDYADEYLWRPAMYFRWEPSFDRSVMGLRFTYEFVRELPGLDNLLPYSLRPFICSMRQWLLSVFGEDVTTRAKQQVLMRFYVELLDKLEVILRRQPFLAGDAPTLVDFGFAGPFFRHFASDFTPRKIMQLRAPAVYEWVSRLWNTKASQLSRSTDKTGSPDLPDSFSSLLSLIPPFLEYYHLNAMAYREGKSSFVWLNDGETFLVPVVPYRVWCRQKLQEQFLANSESNKQQIEQVLRRHGCWELLWKDGQISCPPEGGTEPPFCLYPAPRHRPMLNFKWPILPILRRYIWTRLWRVLKLTLFLIAAALFGKVIYKKTKK